MAANLSPPPPIELKTVVCVDVGVYVYRLEPWFG